MSFSRLQLLGRGRMSGLKPTISWAGNSSRHRSTWSNIRSNCSSTCHASALSPRTQRPRAPAKHLLHCPSFCSPLSSPGKLMPAPWNARLCPAHSTIIGCLCHTVSFSLDCALYPFLRKGVFFTYFNKCSIDKQTAPLYRGMFLSNIKRNELSSYEKTGRKLKCIVLNERSQSEEATYHVFPWHAGKDKITGTAKKKK